MSDPTDLDNQHDETDQGDSPVIRELRQKAKAADKIEKDYKALQQKVVLMEAGLTSLSEKQMKALSAAHDGEWDAENLKATAKDLGFLVDKSADEPTANPPPDTSTMQRMDDATDTGLPASTPDFDAKIASAKSPDEVLALLRSADMLVE